VHPASFTSPTRFAAAGERHAAAELLAAPRSRNPGSGRVLPECGQDYLVVTRRIRKPAARYAAAWTKNDASSGGDRSSGYLFIATTSRGRALDQSLGRGAAADIPFLADVLPDADEVVDPAG